MSFCPNCGSYVSQEYNVCRCGTAFGNNQGPEKERNPTEFEKQYDFRLVDLYFEMDNYSKKAWDYFMDNKFDDALHYINRALDLDYGHANNWNKKQLF